MTRSRPDKTATYHQRATHDAVGKAGKVLDLGGSGQLATGGNAVGHEALVEDGLQLGAGEIDGGGMGSRPGADDDDLVMHPSGGAVGNANGLGRVLLEAGGSEDCDREAGHACAEKSSPESGKKHLGGRFGYLS